MSLRSEKMLSLAGQNLKGKSTKELGALFRKVLESGMHGICFSAYEDGQNPGG